MEQVAWAVTGLLAAALFGNFWFLGAKIDSINSRIDALSARLDARIDALAARIDALAATVQTHIERHPT
jgi:outer membrane murein-binding lipoprotein Lpp